jgi:hypothetical protein
MTLKDSSSCGPTAPTLSPSRRRCRRLVPTFLPAALMLSALCACTQLAGSYGERDRALGAFVAAQDEARHQLRLFQEEPKRSCSSEHLAKASAGADANLALLDPSGPTDRARPLDPSAVSAIEAVYGHRPVDDIANLTLDVAKEAAEAGCPDQARVLYRYVLDRYVKSDDADYRQRAEAGLAEIGG